MCVSARPRPSARRRKSPPPSLRTPSEERAPPAARAGARRGGGRRWRRRRGRRRPLQPDHQVCRHSRVPIPSSFISPTFFDLRHTQISRVVQFKHRARVPVCCAPSAWCGWMIVRTPRPTRAPRDASAPLPPAGLAFAPPLPSSLAVLTSALARPPRSHPSHTRRARLARARRSDARSARAPGGGRLLSCPRGMRGARRAGTSRARVNYY